MLVQLIQVENERLENNERKSHKNVGILNERDKGIPFWFVYVSLAVYVCAMHTFPLGWNRVCAYKYKCYFILYFLFVIFCWRSVSL